MYRSARKLSGISIEEAAFRLHIAPRTLCKYEAGETTPPPEVVLEMSSIYGQSEMTQRYCRECPIGRKYSYEVLNNVNMDPASVLMKLASEYREAGQVLDRLQEVTVNKNRREDFTDLEWQEYVQGLHELLDLEHNIECLKLTLGKWCDISELVEQHNNKCLERGYIKKERTAEAVR